MEVQTVIIQAGGQGTRMGHYTQNRPKCLIPHKGKTILENNLNYLINKKIIIIVDHLSDLLINYAQTILKRSDIIFIKATQKSTSSGLKEATSYLANDEPFALIWSDLFLEDYLDLNIKEDITVGITNNFTCRWKFENNKFIKESGSKNGVMGIFLFKNKDLLSHFDETKTVVGGNLANLDFLNIQSKIYDTVIEIGELDTYEALVSSSAKCRFFNKIEYKDKTVIKTCVDSKYSNLINDEIDWYTFVKNKINFIPELINVSPFTLSKLEGKHLYSLDLSSNQKYKILDSIYFNLDTLHNIDTKPSLWEDIEEIYINKTFNRVYSVSSIIPYFNDEYIKINNKLNLNPFHPKNIESFKTQLKSISVPNYNIIHGDTTFSNILLVDTKCYFIDPRGYFGNSKIYGDKNYDWAKLYYSVNGNYDSINLKKFEVKFGNSEVYLYIKSNGFEECSQDVIQASKIDYKNIELLHSLIWLSLTGYVKEDIEAIFYSFYKGIELWNLTLK